MSEIATGGRERAREARWPEAAGVANWAATQPACEPEQADPARPCSVPPDWVFRLLGGASEASAGWRRQAGGLTVRRIDAGRFALLSASIPDARHLSTHELQTATASSYRWILAAAGRPGASRPVRMWNFIPGILEPMEGFTHRYMAFNAARFAAYEGHYEDLTVPCIPTATGVGTQGEDLGIHALVSTAACMPLENPRQRPARTYSERYGPYPPCFARAGVLDLSHSGRSWLLVGGTASVRGEQTMHSSDLGAQARETFLNLSVLIDVGLRASSTEGRAAFLGELDEADLPRRLDRYRFLRVYYVTARAQSLIASWIDSHFRRALHVEYVQTDLCRPDLLIEIEGVAELGSL